MQTIEIGPKSPVKCFGTEELSGLCGRILTALEATGMQDVQLKAIKDVIRTDFWRTVSNIPWITQEQLNDLLKKS